MSEAFATAPERAAVADALGVLGSFAGGLEWAAAPDAVKDRTLLVLYDTLGVMAAGAQTDEARALISVWNSAPGSVPLVGTGQTASEESACWINGTNVCSLELDEGSKYARGHPAAHTLPAAVAVGSTYEGPGEHWLAAFLAGYDVAARFGRATALDPGVHPHGTWGAVGAATAAGRLVGLDGVALAGAIDAASGLALAPPFSTVFAGSFVRNTWIGAASVAGLTAARLALAGLAAPDGTASESFGRILGTLDVSALADGLGERYEIMGGYFKRHAACAYTHPAADAVLALRAEHAIDSDSVVAVEVETYELASRLGRAEYGTRLGAMFSIPYVIAETLREGSFGPTSSGAQRRADPAVQRLAERVSVRASDEFEARLPAERGARVSVVMADGVRLQAEARNPIGDADCSPLGWREIEQKLATLLGLMDASALRNLVVGLPEALSVSAHLADLAKLGQP